MPWKCAKCGVFHTQNSSRCVDCGHTIFQPVSRRELYEHSDGIQRPKAMEITSEHRVGRAPDTSDIGVSSPDVNLDGSIKQDDDGEEGDVAANGDAGGVFGRIRALVPF